MEEGNNNIRPEAKQGRKSSWESKSIVEKVLNGSLSKTTGDSGRRQYARSETPSSVLSSDSDIRFTKKVGSRYRCPCCVAAFFILSMIAASLSLYAAYAYVLKNGQQEKAYRGMMRVVEGDWYRPDLADPDTELFQRTATFYREALNLWLRRSTLRPAFLGADVLAFDGRENEDLLVYFQLRFSERRLTIHLEDVLAILVQETPNYLGNRTIDPSSIVLIEADKLDDERAQPQATSSAELAPTTMPPAVRVCAPMELPYCAHFSNSSTSYPNLIGHTSAQEVIDDVITFRELVDSECYRLAYEFVCQILQPSCADSLILPCKTFCEEFWSNCGSRLPPRLTAQLNCSNFPDFTVEGNSCIPKPGCSDDLKQKGLSSRLCDGVPDCPDLSDETSCSHCPPGNLLCASSKACIPHFSLCNGTPDCPDGSDERACLALAPSLSSLKKLRSVQSMHYFSGGNVIFTEKGLRGKLCVENLNQSMSQDDHDALKTIGNSLCKNLSFRNAITVNVEKDKEADSRYVKMENPKSSEISFIPTHCQSKEILSVQCNQLECGLQSTRKTRGIGGMKKASQPGDWPWHVALFKSGIHICDATIVTLEWIITTASCFQGQGKAEWIALAGTTRLGSHPPWQQERHVVGMVKSPVEGSTVALLKLERPYLPSDYVRPICLPPQASDLKALHSCNSLSWSQNRTVLQRIELKMATMERCSNISITTVNSFCADSAHNNEDCTGEELAGSPLICLDKEGRWVLAGMTNWRIACSKVGDQRPRLYDQTITNVDWVFSTINSYATP